MQPEIQTLCLEYITHEWRSLSPLHPRDGPPIPPPWGVWIRLYDSIPYGFGIIEGRHVLRKAWFLTDHGVQERDPWEYARFIVVNSYCPWAAWGFRPHMALWGDMHQIAVAAFAQYIEEPDKIYLEMQWGVRFGQGYCMVIDKTNALQIEKRLWRS